MRVSLIGGGTDLPAYQEAGHTGMIISFAIPYRVSVAVNQRYDDKWVIQYSQLERVKEIKEIKHNIIREALKFYEIDKPLEIHIMSDISTVGTGLGGSSALTCALVKALRRYLGKQSSAKKIFLDAKTIEINQAGAPIGIQDFVPAAYGGLNFITIKNQSFHKVKRLYGSSFRNLVKNHFMLINQSDDINIRPHYVNQNISGYLNLDTLKESANLALKYANRIANGVISPITSKEVIGIIEKSHVLKEQNKINRSTEEQIHFLKKLENSGVMAYRRCGAGNHGFYLVYVKNKEKFRAQIKKHNILDIEIESTGAQIESYRGIVNGT